MLLKEAMRSFATLYWVIRKLQDQEESAKMKRDGYLQYFVN